ncbi:SIMPL domain-containing protein [Nocardioides marmorisolisilvae]|uniref:DUF541 domain-containing protein n=1 Tax=Nocardioides marmorisolisilvae TaxID=1542737 RepID=A0A3N0DQ71_9ACTN|nr:SIMPL domain-containing protein [Nocardioides marmorisolisilvae]RNL77788.1 DUF541 domain-containing protein [Nocardioides marmorisolisilvae]
MPENNALRSNQLITIAVLVIALAAVFFVGRSLGEDNGSDDSEATPAASTTETFGVVTGGEATISGTPDQLTFSATVHNKAGSNGAALTMTNKDVRAIIDAAQKHGVATRDIQTRSVSVQPDYDYSAGSQRITGYTATERVSIKVRKLGKAGTVIGAVTTAAGNAVSVGSISFSISNRDDLVAQARTNAVKKSKAAAEALAKAAGRDVGELEYVEEVTPQDVYAYPQAAKLLNADALFRGSYSTPIRPGKQQVSVTVKVRWSIAR